jgi:proton-translocating NADH-quinone oxidoreductase chain N
MGDTSVIFPLVILVGGAFIIYIVARFITKNNAVLACLTAVILGTSLIFVGILDKQTRAGIDINLPLPSWGSFDHGGVYLQGDPGALLIVQIALGLAIFVAVYSGRYLALDKRYETYYPLLLLLISGLTGMVLSVDLFNLYLFCELMSITTYVLVAFRRHTDTAVEAGFKYLIMGSVGTITMLLGISFVFRATGQLSLPMINTMDSPFGRIGLACLLVGLGIKSAIVPLHTWLPDAHGRAPSSISTLLSGIVIQSALYALLKVSLSLGLPQERFGSLILAIGLLNMTVGNAMALVQRHTKRLLAFSTVAQMGYVLFAIGTGIRYANFTAVEVGFFMLTAHAGMKGLAFLCKGIYHFTYEVTTIDQLRGLSWNLPVTAVCFVIALAGLAGIPPLAGFVGKWLILTETMTGTDFWTYAGVFIFLANTLIGLGYYLPLIAIMFSPTHPDNQSNVRTSRWMQVPVIVLAAVIVIMGLSPNIWLKMTSGIGQYLLTIGK